MQLKSTYFGYHPCFIRDDIDGPFVIEFQDRAL